MSNRPIHFLVLCLCGALCAGAPARADGVWDNFDALIAGSKKAMMADPMAGLKQAQDAERIAGGAARSPRQTEAVATGLWLEAEALTRIGKIAQARAALDRAIKIAGSDNRVTKLDGDIALSDAQIADSTGDVARALKSYQHAHDIFARLGEARSQSIALQRLGAIYDEAHDFAREIRYYQEADRVYSQDPALELAAANNAGYAMQQMGRYGEALENFKRALAISRTLKSRFLQSSILSNIAAVHAKQHNFAAAQDAVNRALALLDKDDQSGSAPFVWGVKAEVDYERGALAAAGRDLDRAFRGIDLKTTIAPFRDMHEIAYKVYRALGNNALALAHLEAFKRLDDQGRSLAASANLALMGAQFDFATQQLEIEHLQSEQLKRDMSLRESRAATQRVIFTALLAGVVILMLWFAWRHLLMRRHRNAIRLKNIALTRTLGERDVEIVRRTEVEAHLRIAMEAAEQANRAKSHFLANMSHELRTPLNAIIGFSELMAHGAIAGPKLREYASDINTSGQNLLAILNDILDMARIDAGTVVLADNEVVLGEIVARALEEIEPSASAKDIRFDDANRDLCLRGDDKRLRQILVNLLSNAVKFTAADGRIDIRIERAADGVDLVVRDNGVGIPDDKLAIVMEPFGQAESAYARLHGGVGLGLPIVKSLVQMHGGRFTLSCDSENGTVARVHLPADRILATAMGEAAAIAS
jgi:signal transduction histidine kinase/Tfp pilus assembly protein PilF